MEVSSIIFIAATIVFVCCFAAIILLLVWGVEKNVLKKAKSKIKPG